MANIWLHGIQAKERPSPVSHAFDEIYLIYH
jgi:hypothetical protein